MPQMMPMNWLLLFLMFSISWILFYIKIFFSTKDFSQSKSKNINYQKMNWSW